jgi:hypothetical protein
MSACNSSGLALPLTICMIMLSKYIIRSRLLRCVLATKPNQYEFRMPDQALPPNNQFFSPTSARRIMQFAPLLSMGGLPSLMKSNLYLDVNALVRAHAPGRHANNFRFGRKPRETSPTAMSRIRNSTILLLVAFAASETSTDPESSSWICNESHHAPNETFGRRSDERGPLSVRLSH